MINEIIAEEIKSILRKETDSLINKIMYQKSMPFNKLSVQISEEKLKLIQEISDKIHLLLDK